MTELPKRKKNRLENYDYSKTGAYFITICTKDKQKLFSEIVGNVEVVAPNTQIPHHKTDEIVGAAGNMVRGFKAGISRGCGFSLWQRNYHDRIIRDEKEYKKVWKYIDENPAKWAKDEYFV